MPTLIPLNRAANSRAPVYCLEEMHNTCSWHIALVSVYHLYRAGLAHFHIYTSVQPTARPLLLLAWKCWDLMSFSATR